MNRPPFFGAVAGSTKGVESPESGEESRPGELNDARLFSRPRGPSCLRRAFDAPRAHRLRSPGAAPRARRLRGGGSRPGPDDRAGRHLGGTAPRANFGVPRSRMVAWGGGGGRRSRPGAPSSHRHGLSRGRLRRPGSSSGDDPRPGACPRGGARPPRHRVHVAGRRLLRRHGGARLRRTLPRARVALRHPRRRPPHPPHGHGGAYGTARGRDAGRRNRAARAGTCPGPCPRDDHLPQHRRIRGALLAFRAHLRDARQDPVQVPRRRLP